MELHLRGAAPSLPELGDDDELQLSRRIGRGAGSVFRVNGKEVRARDVQILFADAASGAHSAAIIGQGRIGAIVDAKPADRRRLLEEAAGIGGLQARRHEAELKLQAAETNLLRVQDLLVTLGEQHRQLRKQAREASRYRELSAAYREVEAALLACRWRLAALELAAAERLLRDGRTDIELRSERLSARAPRASTRRPSSIGCASAMPRWPPIWPGSASAVARSATRLSGSRPTGPGCAIWTSSSSATLAMPDCPRGRPFRERAPGSGARRTGRPGGRGGHALRAGGDGGGGDGTDARDGRDRAAPGARGPGGARGRARQLQERLVESAERRRALAEAEQADGAGARRAGWAHAA